MQTLGIVGHCYCGDVSAYAPSHEHIPSFCKPAKPADRLHMNVSSADDTYEGEIHQLCNSTHAWAMGDQTPCRGEAESLKQFACSCSSNPTPCHSMR